MCCPHKLVQLILLGCVFIIIIGFVCSYLFSVRWPWIVGVVIGVLGFLGNIMEKNDKGKIKENEQAAALIAAYRQRGYKL